MAGVTTAYTTKELADLLGITVHGINYRAKGEGWISRPRPGRGGGHEWLLESMPEPTRHAIATAIAARIAQEQPVSSPHLSPDVFTVNTLSTVPERKRGRASARALLVRMAQEFGAASGSPCSVAYEVFCHEYNGGNLAVPEWVRDLLPHVCRASLRNWEKAIGSEGLAALAGKHGQHRKGCGVIDSTPGMANVVAAHIYDFYEVSAQYTMRALRAKFRGQPLPSLRNLQRWMQRFRAENESIILNIQNPDGWRNKYQSAAGSRSDGVTGINEFWELDSSPADILLADGRRYTVIGGIDVGTRRGRLHLSESSSVDGVCSLLRRSFLDWGKPAGITMDNGPEYSNLRVVTVMQDMGVTPHWCTPFSPEEKPHIERFFRTFQRSLTTLPGFIGHSVADRKAIESRRSFAERVSRKRGEKAVLELRYTPEEFQRYCDIWCEDIYGETLHSALGVSPNEAAARAGGTVQRIADERALDLLLMPIAGQDGIRRVGKKGIRADRGTYNAPELGGLDGQDVRVRMDGRDAGYTLYRCLQWHLEEFVRYFKWVLVARDEFERLKVANPDTLTDIQRAARFYYLQQACFGGRIASPTFGYGLTRPSKLNLLRIEEYLSAAHLRLARVYVECLPYSEVIARYDAQGTFFYIDPPYWNCEGYYGPGIFSREDFTRLAEQLAGIKGRFLLSLNDTPGVRAAFKGFEIEAVQTKYSCSNGKNVAAGELLIQRR